MIGKVIGGAGGVGGLANAARDLAEVFTPNATRKMELSGEAYAAALAAAAAEFSQPRTSVFDGFVNGLNRLPRPALALGTLGLFVYAMADPGGFGVRMQGLAYVPEPLWWLLGAIVSFYFGAREAFYFRGKTSLPVPPTVPVPNTIADRRDPTAVTRPKTARKDRPVTAGTDGNAALDDWRATRPD